MQSGIDALMGDSPRSVREGEIHVGLIGQGIQKSRTPAMHEAEGRAQGLHYNYRLLDTATLADVPPLGDILEAAQARGYTGLNVTYPYKIEVMAHLDELSNEAAAVGAVNTVVFRNGRRIGHNTDYWGFAESFRNQMDGAPRDKALLVGAGGAGSAVAHALIDCGVRNLIIFDSEASKADGLARAVNASKGAGRAETSAELEQVMAMVDGFVNATPVGMAQIPGMAVPEAAIRQDHWVADIIYFPIETALLRAARSIGCRTLDGTGMAVLQAVRAFELFSGLKADEERMRKTFRSFD